MRAGRRREFLALPIHLPNHDHLALAGLPLLILSLAFNHQVLVVDAGGVVTKVGGMTSLEHFLHLLFTALVRHVQMEASDSPFPPNHSKPVGPLGLGLCLLGLSFSGPGAGHADGCNLHIAIVLSMCQHCLKCPTTHLSVGPFLGQEAPSRGAPSWGVSRSRLVITALDQSLHCISCCGRGYQRQFISGCLSLGRRR